MIEFTKRLEPKNSASKFHHALSFLGRESQLVYVMNFMVIKAAPMAVHKSIVTSTAVSMAMSLAATIIVVLATIAIRRLFARPTEVMVGKL